ncbi:MAG: hypothetical protein LBV30_10360 [Propionibacteriaceae bacterium]|nr:hypothetical protein [Propionibacteriaceae bacterium]
MVSVWAEAEFCHGDGETTEHRVLVNPAVDGITADVYLTSSPSPFKLTQGVWLRGQLWMVAVVREWQGTGTQLAVSLCNKQGTLYRREAVSTAYGNDYRVIERVAFAGVWRFMSSAEQVLQVKLAANLMPVGGFDWSGQIHDLIHLSDDDTWWEQYGPVMSDRSALSMVLTGAALVQFRQVPAPTGDQYA